MLDLETHEKCKVEQTEQKFGKSCAAIHVDKELSASLCSINTTGWCCFGHSAPVMICSTEMRLEAGAGYFSGRGNDGVGACGQSQSQHHSPQSCLANNLVGCFSFLKNLVVSTQSSVLGGPGS